MEQAFKAEIADLHESIKVAGIPEHSLTGRMVNQSLQTLDRALNSGDTKTFSRCLENTKALLNQWNEGLTE